MKLIEKLKDNMQGWYPAICRVLLACVGPYKQKGQQNLTAFNILKEAMYYELQEGLPRLAASKPERIPDYLPDNVTYDVATTTLTHTYHGGDQVTTRLATLNLQPVNLLGEDIRFKPAGDENNEASH